ncbi:hypothetical protein ACOSQ4_029382 [Xanthoceras sorbifolium]
MSSHMQYTEQNMYSCLPLVTWGASSLVEDDVKCLGRVKSSLNDPGRKLSSWSFPKTSVAFLCNLQALDLSNNELSGRIPAQIYSWLPYLVTVDLSNNDIPGYIPPELGKWEVPPSFSGVSRARLSIEYIFMGAFRIQAWVEVPFGELGRGKEGMELEEMIIVTGLSENVIALTREGTTYKAVLLDESMLATKLLNTCKFGEQFQPLFLHQNISSTSIQLPFLHQNIGSKMSVYVNGDLDEFGSIAPEYSSTMVPSLKGDVYGLGIVLLELVTGQKPL